MISSPISVKRCAAKCFADLNEQEVLALAISNEEEDNRIYRSFADGLRASYPETAAIYDRMAQEEIGHHDMLLDLYRKKFGDFLPLIRRQDVKGFVARRPIWLNRPLGLDAVRKFAEEMEFETARFYRKAAEAAHDDAVRDLLTRLAAAEDSHEKLAQELGEKIEPSARAGEDETARRMFVLQYVQPGLAGLMDGSVSTLAPLFAAAFATHNTWQTFLVGLAASIGAGISMGFAEALSDDGSLTGRGAPLVRGVVCGLMTTSAASAMRCLTSSRISMRRPRSPSWWSSWSLPRSPGSAPAIWTRRSCRPPFKSWWAACLCSQPAF